LGCNAYQFGFETTKQKSILGFTFSYKLLSKIEQKARGRRKSHFLYRKLIARAFSLFSERPGTFE